MADAHRVVVVGAGAGGLACAIDLAARGLDVTVLERAATVGGKLRQVQVGGAAGGAPVGEGIDAGPTVFTMRWVFEKLYADAGATLADELVLAPLDVLARHAWDGDARLDLHAERAVSAEAIGRFAGAAEARRFLRFCEQAKSVYRTLEGPYIRSTRPSLPGLGRELGPRGLAVLAGLGPFASLWRALARHFRDPRLQQLFGRYATYCGSSPLAAPATLMLVAQVEMDGVWSVRGGMVALAHSLARLAQRRGARVRCDAHVAQILVGPEASRPSLRGRAAAGRVRGVLLDNGERIDCDAVVFNGDASALALGLLGDGARAAVAPSAAAPGARSLSALTWALKARTSGFPLARHNVFFQADYASEFEDIFRHDRLPTKGTVYVCAQDRQGDAQMPGDGAERLLCLVNAPALGDRRPLSPEELDPCETNSFALLQRCGLTIERQAERSLRTVPQDFHRLFPATGGALYGPASHGWMAAFRRPASETAIPGLYLAGGSVHPGPGVPMAAMSGRLAAATLLAHLDSTSRSRAVRISGGTSMP